jgi:heptosyltransferase I
VLPAPGILEQHAVERNWLFAQALGMGHLAKTWRFPVHAEIDAEILTTLNHHPRPWIALGPGARWVTKQWAIAHYVELAKRALQATGGTIVLAGGPEDTAMAAELRTGIGGNVLDFVGKTSLPKLSSLLKHVDVFIGNDSGPLHLAAGQGTRVLAPFTCTKAWLHGPYGQLQHGIETKVHCAGSYIRTCPNMICMQELTPDRLWPTLEGILDSWKSSHSV